MLADPCADPGIFARGVQARLPEHSSDNVFFLSSTFTVFQWLIDGSFKESYNFTRFREWERLSNIFQEVLTFSRGDQTFSRGGGGGQMLILETHRTYDFPGGGCEPSIPLPSGSAHVTI